MGKILTYEDIEAEGGYVDTKLKVNDQGVRVIYEGGTHCPSAQDWDLRVYNAKNPYNESSTQCTDTIDTANAYKANFGWGCLDDSIVCLDLNVTFEDGLNYKIAHGSDSTGMAGRATIFTIGTSGYPSSNYIFHGFAEDQYLYYHRSSFYKIASMTIKLSKPVTGSVQLYSGTNGGTLYNRLLNFGPRIQFPKYIRNASTLTVKNVTIPYGNFGNQQYFVFIGLTQDFTS